MIFNEIFGIDKPWGKKQCITFVGLCEFTYSGVEMLPRGVQWILADNTDGIRFPHSADKTLGSQ